jgi:RHS repeat-associated core domain|nr:RHS repeat-associated core domain-containing protein [uncultured Chryseobacterium sp.]
MVTGDNGEIYGSSMEYLDGFHYSISSGDELWAMFQSSGGGSYESEAFMAFLNENNYADVLKFVPTAEGFYDFENNKYIYQYKDHLGNVRLSYQKEGNGVQVVDSNDYYPFGMSFIRNAEEEAYFGTGNYKNYKFQEQELQETGFYTYKWRQYMPDVGRFFNIDPLSEKYAYQSHYNFSENRVVDARELEGLEKVLIQKALQKDPLFNKVYLIGHYYTLLLYCKTIKYFILLLMLAKFVKKEKTRCGIESLNKSILCWFSRLDISDFNPMLVAPICKNATRKLGTIICSNCFGFASFFYNPFQ